MKARTRIRMIWGVAAVTIAYALSTVLVYYTTGEFNEAWLGLSLIVYAILLVAALVLAWTDTADPSMHATHPVTIHVQETHVSEAVPKLEQDVVYRTRSGETIRSAYGTAAQPRVDYLAVGPRETQPVRAIEARLDAETRAAAPAGDVDRQVDAALRRRQAEIAGAPVAIVRSKKVGA